MIRAILLIMLILLSRRSEAQTTFSECHDTLHSRIMRDTVGFDIASFIDWQDCIKGKQMPFLSVQTITGKKIETQKLLGKVIVYNLWFTGCHPCIAEMPILNKLVADFSDQSVVFFGLCLDSKEILEKQFFPKYRFDFTIIPDAENIINQIGQTGYPTTYVVDRTGKVTAAWCLGIARDENSVYQKLKEVIERSLNTE